MKSHARIPAMNVPLRKPMSLPEFLEWEERQPIAMSSTASHRGDDRRHHRSRGHPAKSRLALGNRLSGKPCQFFGSDLKIQVAGDHIRYPDGIVVCTPLERTATVVHDPVVIFEVLGPSTASTDRIVKAREYQAKKSVQRYVMLEQDRLVGATVYARVGDS